MSRSEYEKLSLRAEEAVVKLRAGLKSSRRVMAQYRARLMALRTARGSDDTSKD